MFCDGRGKRGIMVEKCCYNEFYMNFFWGGKAREYSNLIFFFKTAIFGHILKKTAHSLFGCMAIPLDPHSVYT
jgi:hypothetical protein